MLFQFCMFRMEISVFELKIFFLVLGFVWKLIWNNF